jgi:hypothetical protein
LANTQTSPNSKSDPFVLIGWPADSRASIVFCFCCCERQFSIGSSLSELFFAKSCVDGEIFLWFSFRYKFVTTSLGALGSSLLSLFTYAVYSPRMKRVVQRQDCIFLTSVFPMRAAQVDSGLSPDSDALFVFVLLRSSASRVLAKSTVFRDVSD